MRVRVRGKEGAQVGRLHQAGTATCHDLEASPPQIAGKPRDVHVGNCRAWNVMPTHEADHSGRRGVMSKRSHQAIHGGVVEPGGQHFRQRQLSRLPVGDRPLVDAGIPRLLP